MKFTIPALLGAATALAAVAAGLSLRHAEASAPEPPPHGANATGGSLIVTARGLDELAAQLRDSSGLGPRLLELHRDRPEAALRALAGSAGLTLDSKFSEGVLARTASPTRAEGLTLVAASLEDIERAELEQGEVVSDTRWQSRPGSNRATRRLVLRIDGTEVTIDQERVDGAQTSTYSWSVSRGWGPFSWKYYGRGNDRLLPVVDSNSAVRAHVLISRYDTDYDSALKQLGEAMSSWKKRSERLARAGSR